MALDEPKEDDKVFDEDGITYVIDSELFERAKPIQVDFITSFTGAGFSISSGLAADSSSAGACSSSSCNC